jgi:ABC-type glycerol-3-phosphate transport system substrate-binding protein
LITRTAQERGVADESLAFLEWWTGSVAQAEWGRRLGQIPVNRDAQEAIAGDVDEKTAMFIRQSVEASTHPRVPRYGLLETANWNPIYARMLQGNLEPQEALGRIERAFYRVSLDLVNEDGG